MISYSILYVLAPHVGYYTAKVPMKAIYTRYCLTFRNATDMAFLNVRQYVKISAPNSKASSKLLVASDKNL